MKEFLSIVKTSSDRMVDASAAFCAQLTNGDQVYVAGNTKCVWYWDASFPLSTTPDNITACRPTAWGTTGAFVRGAEPVPNVMSQLAWCFDASTGDDENTGLDAANALKTTAERRRRMGSNPQWGDSAYHLRYLSDATTHLGTTNFNDIIAGQCVGANTTIYIHGSMTDRAGATTVLSGALTTVTAIATATNIPWSSTSADVPVSWTASGLVDKRIRLTNGANVNALAWVTKDLGGAAPAAAARFSEFITPVASFTPAPFVQPTNASAGPSSGNTFVVETLRAIQRIHIDLEGPPVAAVTATKVILDSVDITLSGCDRCVFYADGCRLSTSRSTMSLVTAHNCQIVLLADGGPKVITGGYSTLASFIVECSYNGPSSVDFWTSQGSKQFIISGWGTGASPDQFRINRFGMFDNTFQGILVAMPFGVRLAAGFVFYGSGNTSALIYVAHNCNIIFQSGNLVQPIVTSSTPQINFGARTTTFPFDQAATPPQYKAAIDLTFTNITTAVASGGFGDTFTCPVTGCGFIKY